MRVLIADCTHMGSQLLAEALCREGRFNVIGCAATWAEVAASMAASPDVIVLAANFEKPGGGLEIPAKIAGQACPAVVILLDDAGNSKIIVQAFRAGARGVFSRAQSVGEMCKCIECVARGQVWASGEQLNYILDGLKHSVVPRFANAVGIDLLSRREQEVVRYLCDGLPNRDIANALGLSEHTVKNHLLRIYAKLGVDSRTDVMFALLGHAPPANRSLLADRGVSEPPPGRARAPADSEALRWYLRWSEDSLRAPCLPGSQLNHHGGKHEEPYAAYTWLVRSERGVTELLHKCRALRELLGSQLTSEQRQQAERRASRPGAGLLYTAPSHAPSPPERPAASARKAELLSAPIPNPEPVRK